MRQIGKLYILRARVERTHAIILLNLDARTSLTKPFSHQEKGMLRIASNLRPRREKRSYFLVWLWLNYKLNSKRLRSF